MEENIYKKFFEGFDEINKNFAEWITNKNSSIKNVKTEDLIGKDIQVKYNYVYPIYCINNIELTIDQIKKVKIIFKDGSESISETNISEESCLDGNCTHHIQRLYVKDNYRGRNIVYMLENLIDEGVKVILL
ncbi:hypothetical protein ACSW8L_15580 (plasmid) [Clostridium perfringens]